MDNQLQEIITTSANLVGKGFCEIKFRVTNPGSIIIVANIQERLLRVRRTHPNKEPEPLPGTTVKHKIELFLPGGTIPMASRESEEFPAILKYDIPLSAVGLSGEWLVRLTNESSSSHEFTFKVECRDEIYDYWITHRTELADLGNPITGRISVANGVAAYFQHGCLWKGYASDNEFVECAVFPPLLGQTRMVNVADTNQREFFLLRWRTSPDMSNRIKQAQPDLFTQVWADKLVLKPVGKSGDTYALKMKTSSLANGQVDVKVVIPESYEIQRKITRPGNRPSRGTVTLETVKISLPDSTFYDLGLRLPDEILVLAPHIVYARRS